MIVDRWLDGTAMTNAMFPALAAAALIGGGFMIILAGASTNSSLSGRRLDLVQGGTDRAAVRASDYVAGWKEASAGWYAEGLTQEERWQAVRSLAGLRVPASLALALFAAVRFCLAMGGGGAAYFASPHGSPMTPVLFGAIAGMAGWFGPLFVIRFQLRQHRKSVGAGLPDALELLAVCVGAGLSLESALQRVSGELQMSRPALSGELALTWAEISISPDRERALANLAERVNLPAVQSVIGTLSQSLRFGTPLTQSLRAAANEMRNVQLTELEEKGNRLPAMMTIPVMLFIMPTIFLIVGGPAALKVMDLFAQN